MSRRSMRLLTNGYYRENGEIYNETHSPQQQVSYRESPLRGVRVFKKRTGSNRREVSSSNRFQVPAPPPAAVSSPPAVVSSVSTPSFSLGSMATEEQYSGVASALRAAVQSQSLQEVQTCCALSDDEPLEPEPLLLSAVPSGAALPVMQSITSGYSSSEETEISRSSWGRNRKRIITRIRRSSNGGWAVCGDPGTEEPVEPGFTRVLFGGLIQLCFNLLGLFKDALLPSRHNQFLKKPTLTLLTLTLLATGCWYWYPGRLKMGGSGWRSYSALGMDKEPNTAVDFIHYCQNVLDSIEQEDTRWKDSWTKELDLVKQEIGLLKKDGEKQRRTSEVLQTELTNFKDEAKSESLDWQTKISGEVTVMSKYVVGLKNSVSHLNSDHQHLSHRMEAHENTTQLKREVTDWLQLELQTRLGEDTAAVVLRPELQGALEALERRLLRRVVLDQHKESSDVWRTLGEGLQEEGLTSITVKNVQQIVQRALSLYQADGVGMADYALESLGARVIKSKCSKTYHTKSRYFSLFGIPLWYMSESPRAVIQPEVHPGKCWAFEGSQGVFTVALSMPVRVTHITLEHVPKSLSPTGHIDSAPQDFAVFGFSDSAEADGEGEILGRFTYDADGDPIQTFQLPDSAKAVYHAVQLRVLTNWGNPEYSCVYRFRVHSSMTPQ